MRLAILSRIARRLRREDGNVTVEFVIWFPLLMIYLATVVDISVMFHERSEAMAIIQDANRQLSIGRLRTDEQVEEFVRKRLRDIPNAYVDAVIDNGRIGTTLKLPVKDMVTFKTMALAMGPTVNLYAEHMIEY